MLTVTSNAAQVLSDLRESQEIPDHFGVRVFPNDTPDGVEVKLGFAEEPVQGDEIAEAEGTKLFVAPELTEPLSESVIDAEDTPTGATLVLRGPR